MFRDVPESSGMFRNVPCSWFYLRPCLFLSSMAIFNAPVKVNPNPPPPHPGICGALVGFITILADLRVPSMWGIRTFCRFCPEECGALVGDSFKSKMAVIAPTRTSGYITAQGSGNKCSQVFVESVLLLFKSIHRLM